MKIDTLIYDKLGSTNDEGIITAVNSIHLKVSVQWLNQALCLVDSEMLRIQHPKVAANRYVSCLGDLLIFN